MENGSMRQSVMSERPTWTVDCGEGSSGCPSKFDIHDCSLMLQEARRNCGASCQQEINQDFKIIMHPVPWIYELSYMWKSLVLPAYQNKQLWPRLNESNSEWVTNFRQIPIRFHEILPVLFSVLDQKKKKMPLFKISSACTYTLIFPK